MSCSTYYSTCLSVVYMTQTFSDTVELTIVNTLLVSIAQLLMDNTKMITSVVVE